MSEKERIVSRAFEPNSQDSSRDCAIQAIQALSGLNADRQVVCIERAILQVRSSQERNGQIAEKAEEMHAIIKEITDPPLTYATFIRWDDVSITGLGGQRRAVVNDGRDQRVCRVPRGIDPKPLDRVCMTMQGVIVGTGPSDPLNDDIGTFAEWLSESEGTCLVRDGSGNLKQALVVEGVSHRDLRSGAEVAIAAGNYVSKVLREAEDSYVGFEIPEVTFDDIGGLDDVKAQLIELVRLFHEDKTVAERYGLIPERGILFQGVPGCGKTTLGKALANFLHQRAKERGSKCFFRACKASDHRSMWYGETERAMRGEFDRANKLARENPEGVVVLFFDELDGIASRRGQMGSHIDDRVLNAFLAELDGIAERAANVIVIGATNRADNLDPAVTRPGRFGDLIVDIGRPDQETASKIFQRYLRDCPLAPRNTEKKIIETAIASIYDDTNDAIIATVTKRGGTRVDLRKKNLVSGAIIENAIRRAKKKAAVREVTEGGKPGVTVNDVITALDGEFSAIGRVIKSDNVHCHAPDLFEGPAVALAPAAPAAHAEANA